MCYLLSQKGWYCHPFQKGFNRTSHPVSLPEEVILQKDSLWLNQKQDCGDTTELKTDSSLRNTSKRLTTQESYRRSLTSLGIGALTVGQAYRLRSYTFGI